MIQNGSCHGQTHLAQGSRCRSDSSCNFSHSLLTLGSFFIPSNLSGFVEHASVQAGDMQHRSCLTCLPGLSRNALNKCARINKINVFISTNFEGCDVYQECTAQVIPQQLVLPGSNQKDCSQAIKVAAVQLELTLRRVASKDHTGWSGTHPKLEDFDLRKL